ncbi:MAG: aldose 1-epimerase [Bacteroidetes bacterium]|nr:aldose 1-epimerase [Bacteroidota bacterium]
MFEVQFVKGNDFDQVVLRDTATDTSAMIVPSCGAILNAFNVEHDGRTINVIHGYDNAEDFAAHAESKGFRSCKLSPFACRIKDAQYNFGDKSFTIEKFILNGSALHGLLYNVPFTVVNSQADEYSATITLQHEYKATDKGYPFEYTCTVMYTLKAGNNLTLTTEITNNDKGLIPMHDGWHPYFTFGGSINDLQLEFQSKNIVDFDAALIPTGNTQPYQTFAALRPLGETEFDNCFTLNFAECQPLCVLRDPQQQLQLEIRSGNSYPYLQIYTPPHRTSIAIENLSAIPDAFNNGVGLRVLSPGETATYTTTYTITSLL